MYSFHSVLRPLLPLVLVALPLATLPACAGSVENSGSSSTESALTTGPITTPAHGRAKAIVDALAEVPLRADQRTAIEALVRDGEARHAAAIAAGQDLRAAIAAQIEAGAIDRTALQPKLDAVEAAQKAVVPADLAAFVKLHDLLDSDQRSLLVNAVEAKMRDQFKGHRGEHGKGDHMAEWVTALNLTSDQQAQIKSAMQARFEAMKNNEPQGNGGPEGWRKDGADHFAKGKELLESFKNDSFNPPALPEPHQHARGPMLGMIEAALPILTPDQRKIAADRLRSEEAEPLEH